MLWFLLYPIRGTTQPPRLSANHPIRRAFYRHGKTTAQHWLLAMLVSVAIAMGFSYPTIFLSENPTAGFAAYPHHVWTTAKPFKGDESHIDVEMRQVWVHGSYMQALEKDVLKSALSIQQTLVGGEKLTSIIPALNEKLRSSTLSWGYHSPLMYWNNSATMIEDDDDLVRTINDQSRSSSSLNVALRPASVFAGKKFDHRKLRAADALVITLMNKVEDGVGGKWQDKMQSLTAGACKDCKLFPQDGLVTRNRVYEFSFTPLSAQENIALAFAYGCMALYVLLSLRRIKAFHSRFGLVVTAITQMTCSVLASFTICGILKINLSMIPQNAYPFVVLVIGLENMFRLINGILAYPATMATDQRIANALGDIGPVSVATAAQNMVILSLLARFVSPGVAAFCAFACIATIFDAFFLLTFFVAVLNVDIRRLELQDALARSNQQKTKRKPSPSSQHTWFDALMQGRLPFSTRMAGTAVTTTFILSLNYHFFERHEKATGLRHLLGLVRGGPPSIAEFDTFTPPPMNATLTPGEWMRMQDFETAREVMRLAKPGADSFVIRVFAPLIVVLSGSDRTGAPLGTEAWTHALRSFAIHHFYPVAVAIVFAVAFVAVLMNFLLYSEAGHDTLPDDERFEDALTVQSISCTHRLDIVKLAGTERGHLASVGLDRTISISLFEGSSRAYRTFGLSPGILARIRWPVHEVVLDEAGEWLACHCADERILLINCTTGEVLEEFLHYPDDNPPVLFKFSRLSAGSDVKTYFVVVTSGGRLSMLCTAGDQRSGNCKLSEIPLLGAAALESSNRYTKLYTVDETSLISAHSWDGSCWTTVITQGLPVTAMHNRLSGTVSIHTYPDLGSEILVVVSIPGILFLDSQTLDLINKLDLENAQTCVRVLLGTVTNCAACGSVALRSMSMVAETGSRDCSITTLSANTKAEDSSSLCLRSSSHACRSFREARRTTQDLQNSGAWCSTQSQSVLGIRHQPASNGQDIAGKRTLGQTRHRRQASARPPAVETQQRGWEAYKFAPDGELETTDACRPSEVEHEHDLYVNTAGPAVALDSQTIAVAFGNTVKIVRSARRGAISQRTNGPAIERHASSSKRRLTLRKAQ